MRKFLSLLAKAAISGLLLYFALNLVNIDTVAARLSQVAPGWIAAAVLVLLSQIVLLTWRWRQLVVRCGGEFSFARLFSFEMIGAFFNQTLPSSVGGDAMRIWLLGKQTNWRVASYSVLLDRVIGLVALATVVVICLPWSLGLVKDPVGRTALLVIGLGSIGGGAVFLALGWQRLHILQRWTPTRHLAAVATVASDILRSPRAFTPIFLLSVIVHLLSALAAWCAAQSVDADLSLANAVFLVLPVALISVMPISIAGWGVREGAMVAAFAYAGLPQGDGLLVSLLFGISYLLLGALGGIVWIMRTQRSDREAVADSVNQP
jgi:hypothetical protein